MKTAHLQNFIILSLLIFLAGVPAKGATLEEARAVEAAKTAITALLAKLPAESELKTRLVEFDSIGQAHVRLQQFYRQVLVFEREATVHVDTKSGKVIGTTNDTVGFQPMPVVPSVSADRGQEIARLHFKQEPGLQSERDLVILIKGSAAYLAWKIHSEGEGVNGRVDTVAFVSARGGDILRSWNNLHHGASVTGLAKGMYLGASGEAIGVDQTATTTFYLRTPAYNNMHTCNMSNGPAKCSDITNSTTTFGDGKISNAATVAADAHAGATRTLEYYSNVFGRKGIDGVGGKVYSRVHYSRKYENAFWSDSCACMTYGDGGNTFYPLVSIDVAGHEFTHGVTSRTANLTYSGESGGLNEATSDIFGTMVEFYSKTSSSLDQPDYLIGEMILRSNWNKDSAGNPISLKSSLGALRYMYEPSKDGASPSCWSSTLGSLDVHYSSGVANHFFYLLAEGSQPTNMPPSSTCNSATVAGIGRDKAQKIWYRALTVYMTPSTNYSGARVATISAAKDLYDQVTADGVAAAWSAVGVN